MLGYQRAGVSIAMAALVKAGFIEHKRGKVIVSNRPGLEAVACRVLWRDAKRTGRISAALGKNGTSVRIRAQNEIAKRR